MAEKAVKHNRHYIFPNDVRVVFNGVLAQGVDKDYGSHVLYLEDSREIVINRSWLWVEIKYAD